MRRFFLLLMFFTPLSAFPAESHGVPTSASEVLHFGSFAVTNSMIMTWLVTLAILAGAKIFIGRPQLVPSRAQAVVEELLCSLKDLLAPIVGKRVISAAFPLLVSFFVYILLMNWSGLIPGVGNIGAWVGEGEGRHFQDFFRPANSDLNTTLALALISFAGWIYFVLRYAGLRAFVRETFGNKATRSEVPLPLYLLLTVVFLAVGVIEMISIAFRPVSLSLRLYGNVFGGENLLHHLGGILPYVLPVAGYFLEVLVGLIQALVFTMLSAVYIGLVCNHSDEHAGETHA